MDAIDREIEQKYFNGLQRALIVWGRETENEVTIKQWFKENQDVTVRLNDISEPVYLQIVRDVRAQYKCWDAAAMWCSAVASGIITQQADKEYIEKVAKKMLNYIEGEEV